MSTNNLIIHEKMIKLKSLDMISKWNLLQYCLCIVQPKLLQFMGGKRRGGTSWEIKNGAV